MMYRVMSVLPHVTIFISTKIGREGKTTIVCKAVGDEAKKGLNRLTKIYEANGFVQLRRCVVL